MVRDLFRGVWKYRNKCCPAGWLSAETGGNIADDGTASKFKLLAAITAQQPDTNQKWTLPVAAAAEQYLEIVLVVDGSTFAVYVPQETNPGHEVAWSESYDGLLSGVTY